jgi:membrane protein DedA with SNARE-associated domain
MENILNNLIELAITHQSLSYYLIALASVFQGEATFLIAMYLVNSGALNFFWVVLAIFCAVILSDYFLYFLGRFLRKTKLGWVLYKKFEENKKMQLYKYYLFKNLGKVIVLSKFLIGINFLFIFSLGWSKIKFKKFFKVHFIIVFIWVLFSSFIFYFLAGGVYLLKAQKVFEKAEIFIFLIILMFFFLEFFLKNFINQKILNKLKKLKETKEENSLENDLKESNKNFVDNKKVKSEHFDEIFERFEDSDEESKESKG